MDRITMCKQIYERLARLEDQREADRIEGKDVSEIDQEMNALRKKLEEVMNSVCPVIKG